MIIDFGYICMHLQIDISDSFEFPSSTIAKNTHFGVGGHATNQAISAARCGAKVSLIGTIGNDFFGKTIVETLRKEGIHSSGIAKSETPTGIINTILDADNKEAIILSEGANTESSSELIPDNILNERALLLLQNDVSSDNNLDVLKRAQKGCASSMMCLAHSQNLNSALFDYIDIVVTRENIIPDICKALYLPVESGFETLAIQKNLLCIILKDDGLGGASVIGSNVQHFTNEKSSINSPIDTSGAFDSFCGTFAACTQAGTSLPRAVEYGLSAASLTSMVKGIYNAFPYLGDIEESLKHVPVKNRMC